MPFEPLKPAPSRGFTPSRPQQGPMGGGNDLSVMGVAGGGVTAKNIANEARLAGSKAAATAAATQRIKRQFAQENASVTVGKEVAAQEAKAIEQMERNSRTVNNKALNLAAAFKRLKKDAPVLEDLPPSIRNIGQSLYGKVQRSFRGTGVNPAVKSYNGLLDEIATAVGKMAAPSAKVGPDLIKVFRGTLPDIDSSWQEFADQLSFSLQNAEASRSAFSSQAYDPVKTQVKINKMLGQVMPSIEFVDFKKRVADSVVVGDPSTIPSMMHDVGYNYDGTKPDDIDEKTGQPVGKKAISFDNFKVIEKGKKQGGTNDASKMTDADILKKLGAL